MLDLLQSMLTDVPSVIGVVVDVICPPKYFFKHFKLNLIAPYKYCVNKISCLVVNMLNFTYILLILILLPALTLNFSE